MSARIAVKAINANPAATEAAVKKLGKTRTAQAAEQTVRQPDTTDDLLAKVMRHHHDSTQAALASLPSAKRFVLGTVVGLLTYATSVWFAMPLVEIAVIAVLNFTGFAFLSYLVYVLGLFFVFLTSMVAGFQAYQWVVGFDTTRAKATAKQLSDASKRRVSAVRGWFTRSDDKVQYDNVGTC
jgi:hypothetical protein